MRKHHYPKQKTLGISDDSVLVNIIIPVYGRFDLLEQALLSIPEAFRDISVDVTLVDNHSPKELGTMITTNPPTVDAGNSLEYVIESLQKYNSVTYRLYLIQNSTNQGFPKACNSGANRGKAPLLFFMNSDVILMPDSGTKLVAALDVPEVGIAGMRLMFPEHASGLNQNENSRPSGKLQHICLSLDVQGHVYHPFIGWDYNHPRVMKQKNVMAVTGAAMMVRRSLFRQLGGFDIRYGLGTFEDVDLCMKVREAGRQIITVPEALGIHYAGASAETYKVAYPMNENYRIFMDRWTKKLLFWDFYTL